MHHRLSVLCCVCVVAAGIMTTVGRTLVGLTVWGEGKAYRSPAGELLFDVVDHGLLREVRLPDNSGVRFFDGPISSRPTLLPLPQGPPNNQM